MNIYGVLKGGRSNPEGPGTLLLRNQGLKTMIIIAFGA